MATGVFATIDTIASLRAFTGAITAPYSFEVQGFSSIGDDGGGTFVYVASDTTSADNTGTIIVDGSGRRWYRQYDGPVNVRWFGAIGNYNGSTGNDDTTAIQAAITFAMNHRTSVPNSGNVPWISVYFPRPPTGYYVTQSLNCTSNNNNQAQLILEGDGGLVSGIVGKLSAAFPILDMLGNTRAIIRDLGIWSGGGSESCAILLGNCAGNPTGGGGTSLNGVKAGGAIVNIGADLCKLTDCDFSSNTNWAMSWGGGNPLGIASAYQTVLGGNVTKSVFINVNLGSNAPTTGIAYFSSASKVIIVGGFWNQEGGTNTQPCMIKAESTGATIFSIFGLRTESNCSGLTVFQTAGGGSIGTGTIDGDFNSSGTFSLFDAQPANGAVVGLNVRSSGQAASVFTSGSRAANNIIFTPNGGKLSAGTLDSGSFGNTWYGESTATVAATIAANPLALRGSQAFDNAGHWYFPINAFKYNPAASATQIFDGGKFIAGSIATSSYTGGSGLSQVASFTIPANFLTGYKATIQILGLQSATAATGGQIEVQTVTGSTTSNFLAGGIAAGGATSGNVIEIEIGIVQNTSIAYVKISVAGVVYLNSAANIGFTSTNPIVINLLVNNSGSNPYNFQRIDASI